jgi:single-stranded DNA-binding protein
LASDINSISVSGRLTSAPSYATSVGGLPYIRLTIACNENVYSPQSGRWEPIATFFDCVAFADLAQEINSKGLTTGTKMAVTGHMRMEPRMVPGTDIIYKYPKIIIASFDAATPRHQPWKASIWRNKTDLRS